MTAVINYGGRISDQFDNRLIDAMLKDFIKPEIFENKFESVMPYPEIYDLNSLIKYVKELPAEDKPEYFGLHINAQILYKQQLTKYY